YRAPRTAVSICQRTRPANLQRTATIPAFRSALRSAGIRATVTAITVRAPRGRYRDRSSSFTKDVVMNTLRQSVIAAAVLASASAFACVEAPTSTIAIEASSVALDVGHVYFNPWGAWPDPALERFVVAEKERAALNWPEAAKAAEIQTV